MSTKNLFLFPKKYYAIFAFTLFIIGCGSSPKKTPTPADKTSISEALPEQDEDSISAQQYLLLAESAATAQAIELLVRASEQYLQEQQFHQALWLATQNVAVIDATEQVPALSTMQSYRLALVKTQALIALADIPRAQTQFALAEQLSEENNITRNSHYYQMAASIYNASNNDVAAIEAQLFAFSLNTQATEHDVFQLCQTLSKMSSWQIHQLNQSQAPFIKGWLQLLNYGHKFGANHDQFARYLQQWQREFNQHPAQLVVTQLLADSNDISAQNSGDNQNIAVLLPLSGKQQSAGLAAQQGILLAYQSDTSKELHFIDTNQLDMTSLSEQFINLNIDAVIGPLLKANVESYLQQSELTQPTLLLNIPQQPITAAHISAFSMRPEDEAIQAAAILSNQQYQHPIVLSQNDATSQRIANSFTKKWQSITGKAPETISFKGGAAMQDEVKTSLDVNYSNARINELKLRLKQTIKAESRNRRDVDMIYLVGSPQQSRLLKPYIDVNISPFSRLIPVYASSRSHSAVIDSEINNDLLGLTFTEMPWLLASKQQNTAAAQQANSLWPLQSVTLKRIFAMGYDSYALIDKLTAMKNATYVRHYGQTGILQLGENNILTRSLLWGKYRSNKVAEIAMD